MSNLNNDGLFEQVLQAQETQREGWMPEIKVSMWEQRYNEMIATCAHTAKERDDALAALAELNQRLIDRQESFQAQLVRIEDTWREKLRESQSQVVALRKVNNDYSAHLVDMRAHAKAIIQAHKLSEVDWRAMRAIEAALSIPPPPVVSLEEHEKVVKDAERLADAIGHIGASIRSLQDGEIDQWQAYDAISDIETNALDAHEARKGAAV